MLQYFAQDEPTRLDPSLTVYETLASGSPIQMVPQVRNILGGFLFSGDDVYKKVAVLSGGERTRLAVARMLLRPSNTLLLDEPTNHLDIDSKDVLLDALVDYGGTLIFVSHDRYFVDRLATKVIEVGGGEAHVYPGTYEEFHWRKEHPDRAAAAVSGNGARPPFAVRPQAGRTGGRGRSGGARSTGGRPGRTEGQPGAPAAGKARPAPADTERDREARRRLAAETRRRERATRALVDRIADLESRIADREQAIKEIEASMAAPGFYDDREAARPVIDRHQALMWEVGDLMHQWEELQTKASQQ